jgi:hypothetical protein
MTEGVRRGLARQRAEEAAAVAPIGLRLESIPHEGWLSLLTVRLGGRRLGITTEDLGKVAATRLADALRFLVALLLDELDHRAAKAVGAIAAALAMAEQAEATVSDLTAERAPPPDEAVHTVVVPHAPPSVPGRHLLTEAARARAA